MDVCHPEHHDPRSGLHGRHAHFIDYGEGAFAEDEADWEDEDDDEDDFDDDDD